VCHPLDGKSFYGNRPDSSYVDATGGWHDAGDQLKYLITGSNATARMLMAYQWNPSIFEDKVNDLGLPQPNGLADVLDEAKWGLDWIHKLHPTKEELIHQVAKCLMKTLQITDGVKINIDLLILPMANLRAWANIKVNPRGCLM
jgi:hypothetical protein